MTSLIEVNRSTWRASSRLSSWKIGTLFSPPRAPELWNSMASGSGSILLEPVSKPDHAILLRHPTLEAQRAPFTFTRRSKIWIEALFNNDDISNDATEQKLKASIPKSEGDARRHLKGLLSAYSRLKDNRSNGIGHELSRCFTITDGSRDGMVKSMTSSIDHNVFRLKNWIKAASMFYPWIKLQHSRNLPKHFLVT